MVDYDKYLKPPFPLTIDKPIPFGTKSSDFILVQELLCLAGMYTLPDGKFGPATLAALQRHYGALPSNSLTPSMYDDLVWSFAHLQDGAEEVNNMMYHIARDFLFWARAHLSKNPHEVGGQNMGPWVRLYTRGHQGVSYPWCMAFVSYIMYQTCYARGKEPKLFYSLGCEGTYNEAHKKGLTIDEPKEGCIFLLRDSNGHHMHAGIVEKVPNASAVITIEGNTNDGGSREGYKVCRRSRTINGMDFVWPW